MKKLVVFTAALLMGAGIFAVSYKNNTYQKLAKEYTVKAQNALDAGEYDLAEEYAKKAEENAALSEAFIKYMMSKGEADKAMGLAKNRIETAKEIRADINFPVAFEAANNYYGQAEESYTKEDFDSATEKARKVLEVLADIREIVPLPKFYIVQPWAKTKDCFWNISGRPYIYNNPFLWENLYEANKTSLPQPKNPNLIMPGMKMEIPSITGEYRDGVYSPDTDYEPYSANR